MTTKQLVYVPNVGGPWAVEDVVALRDMQDHTATHSHLQLTVTEFFRIIDHSQIARPDCWLYGAVEVRVLVGYEAFTSGSLGVETPLVAMWNPECGCAALWNGGRHQSPRDLMAEVLVLAPRFLTVRERLDRVAAAIQLVIVGDFDWHRFFLQRLFREFTKPNEVLVTAVETGAEAKARVESWGGTVRPVVIVQARSRYEAADLPGPVGSILLAEHVRQAAALIAWDPGDEMPSLAEVPLREAGFMHFWDRRLPLDSLLVMVLDAAGIPETIQGIQ